MSLAHLNRFDLVILGELRVFSHLLSEGVQAEPGQRTDESFPLIAEKEGFRGEEQARSS